ncbi:MAG: LSm family protein [Methanobrevibacter wolinii]|uniref:LSm family protein n=1 Tax=Methanobrevibacter wolinii TaxID=190977 RepID=UPI0005B2960E|nr:LSM domain-containing protein [Methanobrevibacter wolinii]MDD5959154.1 LSM domain protein [Methanobrevibacter wolinii]
MINKNPEVNESLEQFKGKNVTVILKNDEEHTGRLIAIDNFINTVLEKEDGNLDVIKGGKILIISINN